MLWLSLFRISIIIVASIAFYRLTKRLIKIPLRGYWTIWLGIGLILTNSMVGSAFHNLTPELIQEYSLLVPLGTSFRFLFLPLGFVCLLFGSYQLLNSLQEQLSPRYEALVEKSLVGVYRIENGKITYANPRFGEIFGVTRDYLNGREFSEFVHAEDRDSVASAIQNCLSTTSAPLDMEYRGLHSSGREIQIESLGDKISTVDGVVFQGTLQEITERSRFEKLMRKSEERYRRLLEHSQEMIVVHDMGKIEFINPAGAKLLAADEETTLIGVDLLAFFPVEVVADMRRRFKNIVKNGVQEYLYEQQIVRANGLPATIEMTSLPFQSDGKVSIQTLIRDNSERKASEDILTGQKRLLESMARGTTLDQILREVAEFIEEQIPGIRCSISILDEQRNTINLAAAPGMPEEFHRLSAVMSCELGNGPCVGSIVENKLIICEDVQNDRHWEAVKQFAKKFNIQSSCSMPVFLQNDKAVGALTLYSDVPIVPTMRQIELMGIAADIAGVAVENNQLAVASIQSEARYQRLFGGMSDVVLVFPIIEENAYQIIEANSVACSIFGYSVDEMKGLRLKDLLPEDEFHRLPLQLRKLRRNRKQLLEIHGKTRDGKLIPFEVNSQIFDFNGRETVLAIGRDISERKATEKALREKEERFRSLVQYSSDIITILEPDGTIKYISPSVEKLLGYQAPEMLNTCIFDFVYSEDLNVLQQDVKRLIDEPDFHGPLEYRIRNSNGQMTYLEAMASNLIDNPIIAGIVVNSRDITVRKTVQTALAESEERFRTIFDNAGIGILLLRLDGRILESNVALKKMLRVEDYNMRGKLFKDYYSADAGVPDHVELLEKLNLSGGRHQLECRLGQGDNPEISVQLTATLVKNSDDNPQFIILMAEDVTERNNAITALVDSEQRYRDIVENSTDCIFTHDFNGKLISVNRAMVELFAVDASDSLNNASLADFVTEESVETFEEYLQKLRNEEQNSGYLSILSRNSEIVVLEYRNSLRMPVAGAPIVRVVARNVTDHMRFQKALAEEKERLSVTVKSIGDGVVAIDTQNNVILMNEVAGRLLNCNSGEVIGKGLRSLTQNLKLNNGSNMSQLLEHTEDYQQNMPFEILQRDGRKYKITSTLKPMFNADRERIGSVLVLRDVTHQVALEEEVRRTQKLESLGVLAGGIAHDFNNILTAIIGNISLGKLSVSENEVVSLRLDDAERAAMRARELTQQLLTFAKGGAPIKRAASIQDIITETAGFALRGSRSKTEFLIAPKLWNVEVDEGQISQVINNLVLNAAQAMPNGGKIYMLCENFPVYENTHFRDILLIPGNYVRIVVGDEGVGIPREYLEQVFDPYFTTKQKGSGLGLATSYSIIKRHDGYIFVESDYQKGSEFTILLPAVPELMVKKNKPTKALMNGTGKILVMDDEQTILDVASAMLERLGYSYVLTHDGAAAIDAFNTAILDNEPFDAVLLDLTVPGGMSGKDAIEELIKIDPNINALVSSGYSNDPVMAEYLSHGFKGRILKPYNVQLLGKALKEILQSTTDAVNQNSVKK